MAKFRGEVGYGFTEESAPGVNTDVIVERKYFGDSTTVSKQQQMADAVNADLTIGNRISIMADGYANLHFFAIRYVKWAGVYWTVTNVDVQRPRLILSLGEVWNGITADTGTD